MKSIFIRRILVNSMMVFSVTSALLLSSTTAKAAAYSVTPEYGVLLSCLGTEVFSDADPATYVTTIKSNTPVNVIGRTTNGFWQVDVNGTPYYISQQALSTSPNTTAYKLTSFDAKAALVANASNGKLIYTQGALDKLEPASTTKIMTALLVIEAIESGQISLETPVMVSNTALASLPSDASHVKPRLAAGEVLNVDQLLTAMMVSSDCQACNVLAELVAGSVPNFVAMMNAKAAAIGCVDTNFTNPSGYPDEKMYTNAYSPNPSLSENSSYSYGSYSATSTNSNLSGATISNTNSDASAVYITSSGITITNSAITKSGDSSNTENSEFYGVNAAVLVNGGGLTMTGGSITTSGGGANAIVATNSGTVTISGTSITSTGSRSARGLHATYGGTITATSVTISSTGGSCATLATDRGEGTVTCTSCELSTAGSGSPLIYSTGNITVSGTIGTATGAQAVVIEGKNSAIVKDSSNLKCSGSGNGRDDECGIMIYQSQSGDADTGTGSFTCESSTIEILSSSSVYSEAPMFYITNTAATISLTGCTFTYGSGTFLLADEGDWGSSGSNGGTVTLTLTNQAIVGDIEVGSSSSLTITLVNSSINGKINTDKTAAKLAITLDAASTITLTGDSYYTSLTNSDSTNSNIKTGSYTWESYTESSTPSSGGGSTPSTNSPSNPGSTTGTTGATDTDVFDTYKSSSNNLNIYKQITFSTILMVLIFV